MFVFIFLVLLCSIYLAHMTASIICIPYKSNVGYLRFRVCTLGEFLLETNEALICKNIVEQSFYRHIHFHTQFHNLLQWQIVVGLASCGWFKITSEIFGVGGLQQSVILFHQPQFVTLTSCGIKCGNECDLRIFHCIKESKYFGQLESLKMGKNMPRVIQ